MPIPAQLDFGDLIIVPGEIRGSPRCVHDLPILQGVDFLAAHNAPFDSGVLGACCEAARLSKPAHRFICTVRLARSTWNIYPTKLSNVCQHLNIELNHHEALSDAHACAQIVIAAEKKGVKI